MVVRPEEDARGVGEGGRRTRHGTHEGAEAGKLLAVDGIGGFLGGDEMAHDQGEPQAAQAAALVDQDLCILRAETQSVEARVEMDHRVERLVEALGRRPPGVELTQMVEDRNQPVGHEIALGARQEAVQHVDGRLRQHAPQGDALVYLRHEEMTTAFRRQPGADQGRPGAIGIGLQDRGAVDRAARRAAGIAQTAPVGGNRTKVDREDCPGPSRGFFIGRN